MNQNPPRSHNDLETLEQITNSTIPLESLSQEEVNALGDIFRIQTAGSYAEVMQRVKRVLLEVLVLERYLFCYTDSSSQRICSCQSSSRSPPGPSPPSKFTFKAYGPPFRHSANYNPNQHSPHATHLQYLPTNLLLHRVLSSKGG